MAKKNTTFDDLPRLLTRAQVAKWLQVSEKTLRNWGSTGQSPPYITINTYGGRLYPEDVLARLDEHELTEMTYQTASVTSNPYVPLLMPRTESRPQRHRRSHTELIPNTAGSHTASPPSTMMERVETAPSAAGRPPMRINEGT